MFLSQTLILDHIIPMQKINKKKNKRYNHEKFIPKKFIIAAFVYKEYL